MAWAINFTIESIDRSFIKFINYLHQILAIVIIAGLANQIIITECQVVLKMPVDHRRKFASIAVVAEVIVDFLNLGLCIVGVPIVIIIDLAAAILAFIVDQVIILH